MHEKHHFGSISSPVASLDISCVPEGAGAVTGRCTYQQKKRKQELVVPQYEEKPLQPDDGHVEYNYSTCDSVILYPAPGPCSFLQTHSEIFFRGEAQKKAGGEKHTYLVFTGPSGAVILRPSSSKSRFG